MSKTALLKPLLGEEEAAALIQSVARRRAVVTEQELTAIFGWAEEVLSDQVLLELVLQGAADVVWDADRQTPVFFPAEAGARASGGANHEPA